MKKLLLSGVLFLAFASSAQSVIWSEDFENGCPAGCSASGMSTVNGPWTVTDNSPAIDNCGFATSPNTFYVSCAENGNPAGACGTTCSGDESLHIGSTTLGDQGASYDAGGSCALGFGGLLPDTETDIRAESPVINLFGESNITLNFVYMENGQGSMDDASLWYFDGSSWSMLDALAKTTPCGVQGTWTAFSIALPASANNNSNVKIGFKWVNNVDAAGTDPSFAVDDVELTVPGSSASISTGALATNSWCFGTTFSDILDFTSVGTYNASNVYSAEMSDASGSFASPTVIGTLNSSLSGALTININVPGSMPVGTGYRIRVTASDPATTGTDNGTDIEIKPQPTVTLGTFSDVCIYTPIFTLTGGTPTGGTYSGPGVAAGSFDPAAATAGTHTITYSYTDSGTGCTASQTETITVDACAGIEELDGNAFVLYPNPTSGEFTIASNMTFDNLSLVDLNGKRLKTFDVNEEHHSVAEFSKGVYLLKMYKGQSVYTARLLVE